MQSRDAWPRPVFKSRFIYYSSDYRFKYLNLNCCPERKNWKKRIGYHCRSLIETAVFRLKTTFGPLLKNRKLPNQRTEARLRCKILNYFTQFSLLHPTMN